MSRYKIEDKEFTISGLVEILNCTYTSAKRRLTTCKTINELLRPVKKKNSGNVAKIYVFDGVEVTAKEVAIKLNCGLDSARNRIYKAKTLNDIYKKPINYRTKRKAEKEPTTDEVKLQKMNKLLMGAW
ncbi:MAG: hypothetical protein HOK52_10100 [Candidatus Marinimicrobia bacterium]|jgi:hypothetical protein|nr:hypothetical protein [Candidatus Neomarinimicrobiota bacterium]